MLFCDAHIHLAQCREDLNLNDRKVCTCAHSREEFLLQERIARSHEGALIVQAFGIHPQNPDMSGAPFMQSLLEEGRIKAVGESGFDFFTREFRAMESMQEEAWNVSLDLSIKYGVPLIVHCRKAFDKVLSARRRLKAVPSVIMHSFAFTEREAEALLSHGVNAYFSFGKQILNGNKRSTGCVMSLPLDRILLETDAPYQTLRGETVTLSGDIEKVCLGFCALRGLKAVDACAALEKNFDMAFGLRHESVAHRP